MYLGAECLVGEHGFHQVLTIVEISVDRDIAHVGRIHRGHLPALHLAGASLGMQDHDVDARAVFAGFDGGRSGVAGGGADDGDALVPLGEHVVEQPAEKLHCHVLERERGAVEEFERPQVGVELYKRHNGRVAEGGVSFRAEAAQGWRRDRIAHEGLDERGGEFRIGQPAQRVQVRLRPGFGHEQPAILRQPREQNARKVSWLRCSPGRDVVHWSGSNR